ncbi:hypothetical protein R5H30_06275 [Sulfitobacter sp. D35]|uniref:hypothetical protein n=1 Tax=Sulfitobacter sp. D35 TaxID=3083252 RepID=UPI00296F1600|nr:hypothetical protein [Sulfitobacter sp. D35]MDW4497581.1 hypothetical protein [Sulfitobacter sp. D35]
MLTMILRIVIQRLLNKGIDAGFDHFSKGAGAPGQGKQGRKQAKGSVRKARRTSRLIRRGMKF